MEPESTRKSPPAILLVENEKTTLDILCAVLTRTYPRVSIHCASDGKAGLAAALAHKPDIVVTDIKMPEMGGVQMAALIRAMMPETKLIVITGDSGRIECQESLGKGFEFDHYLVKPVAFQELFAAIDRCFEAIAEQIYPPRLPHL